MGNTERWAVSLQTATRLPRVSTSQVTLPLQPPQSWLPISCQGCYLQQAMKAKTCSSGPHSTKPPISTTQPWLSTRKTWEHAFKSRTWISSWLMQLQVKWQTRVQHSLQAAGQTKRQRKKRRQSCARSGCAALQLQSHPSKRTMTFQSHCSSKERKRDRHAKRIVTVASRAFLKNSRPRFLARQHNQPKPSGKRLECSNGCTGMVFHLPLRGTHRDAVVMDL